MSSLKGPAPEEILSGRVGHVGPRRAPFLRLADRLLDGWLIVRGVPRRLDALARELPPRRVLVLSIYRPGSERIAASAAELRASRLEPRLAFGSTEEPLPELADVTVASGLSGGKFQNLNAVLAAAGSADADWVVVVDDDVALPSGFLDRLLAVSELLGLELVQPAQTLASHAAWPVTRRRAGPLARETSFVEIGPVTGFGAAAARELLPFPDLRFGWGLDLHWAALARERGWRLGVIDALPVRHELAGVGSDYPVDAAIEEARGFLASREFVPASEAGRVLAEHRELGR